MKKNSLILTSFIISFLLSVGLCSATTYTYQVNGSAYVDQDPTQSLLNISGYIEISSPVNYNLESEYFSATEDHNQYFSYEISSFHFDIGAYSFYSLSDIPSGAIYSHHYYYGSNSINPSFTVEFDTFSLAGGGNWQSWDFLSNADFFHEDGTKFLNIGVPTDFYNLPYSIAGNSMYGNGIYLNEITMTQLPIPEPTTFFLFGIGMIGYSITRKCWKKTV